MDNSTYGQMNSSRRTSRTSHGNPFSLSHSTPLLPTGIGHPGNAISPAVSSEGRGTSIISSDRSQVPGLISSGTSDYTDNSFMTSDFANYTTGQDYGPNLQADFSEQNFAQTSTSYSETGAVQNAFAPHYPNFAKRFVPDPNAPLFSEPSLMRPADNGSFATFAAGNSASVMPPQAAASLPQQPSLYRQDSGQSYSMTPGGTSRTSGRFDLNEGAHIRRMSHEVHYESSIDNTQQYLQYTL
ncbi:MAG: hypothetical protein M1820_000436 [Bogoriella megaspora]|nr:MAG: hypothetical protein M1820_000436 [Bogoriella megaspora]